MYEANPGKILFFFWLPSSPASTVFLLTVNVPALLINLMIIFLLGILPNPMYAYNQ